MKSLIQKSILFLSLLFLGGILFAQQGLEEIPPIPTADDGVELYLPWVEALYSAFVIIAGWFSRLIPGIRNIPDKTWRVAAIAIVGAGIFVIAGWAKGITLLFAYLIATKVYELFIKPVAPTPDTPADVARKERVLQLSREKLAKAA